MKKIFLINKWLLPIWALVVTLTSCLKDQDYEDGLYGAVRNTEGGMYISVRTGGLNNFSRSNVSIDPSSSDNDTVDLYIDLDYQAKTTSEVTVKIAFDDAKRIAYNTANSKDFQPVTADMVELLNTTITIPAGERVGQTKLVIKQNLFDGAVSYMFPVSITESGAPLSQNLNTRYYNIIGNPLAGSYSDVGYFYHPTGPRAIPTDVKNILPVSPTVLQVDLGDLGSAGYIAYIEVDPTSNHVKISDPPGYYNADNNFLVQFDDGLPDSNPGYTAKWAGSPECNNTYDPATKTLRLRYGYMGGNGWRVTEEILVKQ